MTDHLKQQLSGLTNEALHTKARAAVAELRAAVARGKTLRKNMLALFDKAKVKAMLERIVRGDFS